MQKNIYDNVKFYKAICENDLVYLFGTGISNALTGKSCGWYNWIAAGIQMLKDKSFSNDLKRRLDADSSADNMIKIVGEVLPVIKSEGFYEKWMKDSFEKHHVENHELAITLQKFFILNDVIATTNYDRMIEEATGMSSLTYEEPDKIFLMLKYKQQKSVLHIHGMYDSKNCIDNIIANNTQYNIILNNKGAQFLQNLLGTRTVIFIGCGKTTEDINIAKFIRFSQKWLKIDVTYYYLHDKSTELVGLPNNIIPICYGDYYSDLPAFLDVMICERLKSKIEKQRLVGRTVFSDTTSDIYGLSEYHYSRRYLKFCGRRKELGKLKTFLENDKHYLWWALTGQAGAGKSRLAYEFIHMVPENYFGFFINPVAEIEDAKAFIPFSNTFVVFDYVKGNEKHIANIVTELCKVFSKQEYVNFKLRILFIERENLTISGTWYYVLEQAFSYYDRISFKNAEYKPHITSHEHDFICIDDLDNEAIVELIGDTCKKKGLPLDSIRDQKLRDEYATKFEQLRFRPLFLQFYVQAWIENGKTNIDYRHYREILNAVLNKEKEHLLKVVNGDKSCGVSLIRLLIRAGVIALHENNLPIEYKQDWEIVQKYVHNNTFPGIERKENLFSLVKDASHGITDMQDVNKYVIDPLYPDILKEALFLQYIDDMESFGKELWINAPMAYSIFLYRCIIDFPDDRRLHDYIKSQTNRYDNIPAMYARLALLHHEIIKNDDNPIELQDDINEEYTYWLSVPTNGDKANDLMQVRLEGLHDSLLMFIGWSKVDKCINAIKELASTPDTPILRERKCQYLLDTVKYLTNSGIVSVRTSEYSIDLLKQLLKETNTNSSFYHNIRLSVTSCHILNCLLEIKPQDKSLKYNERDWNKIKEMLFKLKSDCNLCTSQDVEIYAYTIDRCTSLAFEKLAFNNICYFYEEIQEYAVDWAKNHEQLAFNDQIHFYYLHTKLLHVEAFSISSTMIMKDSNYANEMINEYIDEISHNEMIRDFSGLLVGAWALKVGFDDSVTDTNVISYLEKAKDYINTYPDNNLLVEKYFDLVSTALEYQFKRKANKEEIDFTYSLVLRFPHEEGVLQEFFELLRNSSESKKWKNYTNNKQIVTGLIQCNLFEYLEEPYEKYIKKHKKIGANALCPCGSGKKFKKCCRGKGFYD